MRRSAVMDPERRDLSLTTAGVEVRATGGNERFVGHAAVFDTRTSIGNPLKWGFYEEIAPGAFTKTLGEGDARMLIDHDSFYVVSRVSADTLNLAQDKRGLAVDSALDEDLSYVKDLKVNIRNKNITGMSFGFYVMKDEWSTETVETSDGNTAEVEIRRIQEVRLIEVSAVSFPAYEETDAGLRAVARTLQGRGDEDAVRRRLGFRPELASLLDGSSRVTEESTVESPAEEPGESTPRSQDHDDTSADDEASEPGETTRNAPDAQMLAAARLRYLHTRLRHAA